LVLVIGDVHQTIDFSKLLSAENTLNSEAPNEDNYVIVTGDFGLIWYDHDQRKDIQKLYKQYNSFSFTTLFVDGNHDNHDRLQSNEFPLVKMFNSTVKQITDKVFYLQRGHIYTIQNKKIFCMGGAESIDKHNRIEGVSWWAKELPSKAEMDLGLRNLEKEGNRVDYIITHTFSNKALEGLKNKVGFQSKPDIEMGLRRYFDHIEEVVEFKHWYAGHFHYDTDIDKKHTCLYNCFLAKLEQ